MASVAEIVSLSDLPPGVEAVVETLDLEGTLRQRMLDLGLVPGTRVRHLRRAPLGDPSVYELRGIQLSLRRSEAARIRVRTVS